MLHIVFKNLRSVFFAGIMFAAIADSHAQTFTGGGGIITDDGSTIDFVIPVSGLNPATIDTIGFGFETVCINLTHTYDSDLDISLVAPDGTVVMLSSGNGGSGDDYTNTCFNMGASTAIVAGSPPFTGTFKPQGPMGIVNNGQVGNGNWILRFVDTYAADEGTLIDWSITFGSNPATYTPFTSSDLPLVLLNTNNVAIPDDPKIPAIMQIIDYWPAQRNHLTDVPNVYNGNINIERRGNFSAGLPQKPYNLETVDANGLELDTALLGMPSEHDWSLIACYNDKSFIRNMLASDLFEKMGHYAPRYRLCEVVLNGQYNGVYMLCESIKRDKNRVDIAKLDSTENVMPDISGGYITKIDYWDNSNSWQLNFHPIDHQNLDIHMVYVYPASDKISPQQKTYIQQFYNDMETALYGSNFADPVLGYRKYLSIQSFLDYFIVNELARNVDGFKKSRYFHKEKDNTTTGAIGKLKAGPVWDFDWAWNDIWDCSYFQQTDGSGWSHLINDCGPDVKSPGYYVRLLQDTLFANELRCRWNDMRNYMLDTMYLFHFIDSVALRVNEAQQRHFDLYGNLGQVTGTPELDPAYTFAGEIDSVKQWILRRINWLDANMPGNLVNCNNVGLAENSLQQSDITVFPNPFTDEFTVHTTQLPRQEMTIELRDLAGRVLLRQEVPPGRNDLVIPAKDMAPGVYLLQVRSGDKCITRKVIRN